VVDSEEDDGTESGLGLGLFEASEERGGLEEGGGGCSSEGAVLGVKNEEYTKARGKFKMPPPSLLPSNTPLGRL
jgi:hypothetical protein